MTRSTTKLPAGGGRATRNVPAGGGWATRNGSRRRVLHVLWRRAAELVVGLAALVWVLWRSGSKPSRLTYPCQQSALGIAAGAFAAPLALGVCVRHSRGSALSGSPPKGRRGVGALVVVGVIALAVAGLLVPVSTEFLPPITLTTPTDYHTDIYAVANARGPQTGRFGGVDDLLTVMGLAGFKWHRSDSAGLTSGPDGLIAAADVVLLKVNAQWAERGGTNTDVLRGVLRRIVEHPDGFVGEVVVADNGQGNGHLNRDRNNAADISLSVTDVVQEFADEGWKVSGLLWDGYRLNSVGEYATGSMTSGFVVSAVYDAESQIKVSYPKFRTVFGTYISYKYGVWSEASQTYDPDGLVVINMPVLKTHQIYGVTASVKNHMGVVTQSLSTDSHNGVGRGGLGSLLAEVRMPNLTIVDCIWVLARPRDGPEALYSQATERNQLLAGRDPAALDAWAVRNILVPEILANGYIHNDYRLLQDADEPDSKFRRYLDRSMSEMLLGGIATTIDPAAVNLHVWVGDGDEDGDVDSDDTPITVECLGGPGQDAGPGCRGLDADRDGDVDLVDFARIQRLFGVN